MPGPSPKPAALARLEGSPRTQREPKLQAAPEGWLPPDHLKGEARREWRRLVGPLTRCGLLSIADRDAFASYCVWHGRHIEAEWMLKREGMLTTTPNGHKQASPWLTISKHASELKKTLAAELGLTPASRARMGRALGDLTPATPRNDDGDKGGGAATQPNGDKVQSLFGKPAG